MVVLGMPQVERTARQQRRSFRLAGDPGSPPTLYQQGHIKEETQ
jgi:hypothetical protein